jgi:heme/copper-type cytochrome/quinol oxidase subunit 3
MSTYKAHSFHIVDPSPWPFLISLGAGAQVPVGAVMYMHGESNGFFILFSGIALLIILMFLWWWDIIIEGTYQGMHTKIVQQGLRLGFILFVVSEIMFFVSFFWAFFHSSLAPVMQIGGIWPPYGVNIFNPWGVPFLNTLILLTSGVTITTSHIYLLRGEFVRGVMSLFWTIILAVLFTFLQILEYSEASFDISDGIFGSVFFMATGFHGFHVIIGTIFILVTFIRFIKHHLTIEHHIGFEAAAWYWHFVDVVWLFLFSVVYWWTSWGAYISY